MNQEWHWTQRNTGITCPICHSGQLEATEFPEGMVSSYHCKNCNCNAEFTAQPRHDWKNQKHYWVGKRLNPEFWKKLDNTTTADGLLEMSEKDKQGIPEYLGSWIAIEEIRDN